MSVLGRIPGWRLAALGLAAGMVFAASEHALASGGGGESAGAPFTFTVTAPVTGHQPVAGSTISITWTSSSPTSNVNIYLVDVSAWAVAAVVATNTADDGQEFWTIPASLPAGQYLIYIENVGVTDWTYGSAFDILACGTPAPLLQQRAPRRGDTARPMSRDRMVPKVPVP